LRLEAPVDPVSTGAVSTGPVATALAFDFGRRRIGIAVGNGLLQSGEPISVIEVRDEPERFRQIQALIEQWRPDLLVVGRPVYPDGVTHAMTLACERFARQLHGRFGLAVALVDERYSSVAAASSLSGAGIRAKAARSRGKTGLDAHAAAIILRQYWSERDTAP
jgi:putative holliday junction resolvase